MIRLSTSRPSGSVPNQNVALGACMRMGRPRSSRLNMYGSRGASTGANRATATRPHTMTALTAPSGFFWTSNAAVRHAATGARVLERGGAPCARGATRGGASAVADPGIKPAVAQVDEQVHGHDHHRKEQHGALDQRVVAQQHRIEQQAPHPGLQKDELDDDRAAEQDRELLADHRHHRNEGVLQRVPDDDGALTRTLRASGHDVVLAQYLEQ